MKSEKVEGKRMKAKRKSWRLAFILLTSYFILLFVSAAKAQQPTSTLPTATMNAAYLQGRTWADYKPSSGSGLDLNLAAGRVWCNGTLTDYAGGSETLDASDTNYVYLDASASCGVDHNVTGFSPEDIPIARVVTGSSTITSVTDVRGWIAATGSAASSAVRACHVYAGANAGAKIAACIADLPAAGGVADARGLDGAQTIAQDVFSGVSSPVVLLLGAGTYTLSSTQNLGDEQHIIGLGTNTTLLSYTGSAEAIVFASGTQYSSVRDFGIDLGSSSTAVGIQLDASSGVVSRNLLKSIRIDRVSGVVAGQIGLELTGGSSGSDLVSFNHFEDWLFTRVDRPVVTDGTNNRVNQDKFINLSFEQFGDSGDSDYGAGSGNGIAIYNGALGGNNTWTNLSFSKGGSTATQEVGIYDTGSDNVYLGAAHDAGTGAVVWFPTGAANNVFVGTGSTIPTDVDGTNFILFSSWGVKHFEVRNQGSTAIPANVLSTASAISSSSEQSSSAGRFYARGTGSASLVLNHTGASTGYQMGEWSYSNGVLKFNQYNDDFSSLTSTPFNYDVPNDLLTLTGNLKMKFSGSNSIELAGSPTAARTLTLPDQTDTLVGRITEDSLRNKGFFRSGLTLSNGANNDLDIGINNFIKVAGPSAAFSVTGFQNGFDGRVLYLYNSVSQTMTVENEDSGSTAANRILTLTGADVTLRTTLPSFATLIYDAASSRWILVATN